MTLVKTEHTRQPVAQQAAAAQDTEWHKNTGKLATASQKIVITTHLLISSPDMW